MKASELASLILDDPDRLFGFREIAKLLHWNSNSLRGHLDDAGWFNVTYDGHRYPKDYIVDVGYAVPISDGRFVQYKYTVDGLCAIVAELGA